MRFSTEQKDPENAGLGKAIKVLDEVHAKHLWISKADLYVLAGTVAIEAAGGPAIPFSTGRVDFTEEEATRRYGSGKCPFALGDGNVNPSGSRLPPADLGTDVAAVRQGCPVHVREAKTIDAVSKTFSRLGFND